MRHLLTGVLVIATALYPVAVYLWVGELSPRLIGGLLLGLLLIRLALTGKASSAKPLRRVLPFLCVFALLLMLFNHQQLLLWYPVLVNLLMLLVFSYTIRFPPSLVERLARIQEPNLPEAAIAYTRKVTWVWCCFFAVNGLLAAATAYWANIEIWTLYNGLIAYLLMGLMFVVELAVRRRVRNNNEHVHQ